MKTVKLTMNLNREIAIDKILKYEGHMSLDLSIMFTENEDKLNLYLDVAEQEFYEWVSDCRDNLKVMEHRKEELEKLMTHELYELGEKKELWILTEKQKRLI